MSTKVFVYYNLHKHCWSVMDYKTRRVIDHRNFVTLVEAYPVVRQGGRERVLREQKKNVHAGVVGYLCQNTADMYLENLSLEPSDVGYNPYKGKTFVYTASGLEWLGAPVVLMNALGSNKVMAFEEEK